MFVEQRLESMAVPMTYEWRGGSLRAAKTFPRIENLTASAIAPNRINFMVRTTIPEPEKEGVVRTLNEGLAAEVTGVGRSYDTTDRNWQMSFQVIYEQREEIVDKIVNFICRMWPSLLSGNL